MALQIRQKLDCSIGSTPTQASSRLQRPNFHEFPRVRVGDCPKGVQTVLMDVIHVMDPFCWLLPLELR
jgi:hypothetical protein